MDARMYLKEVHMENFKSFPGKLTVPFGPTFTGITGPNGSGKSNIGDAILFVLGPNSPRAIRANRLTDLIFNGAEHGRPAKYMLVTLTFDNTDRTMPLDTDEVHLTRKVSLRPRKDDPGNYTSQFYVNGRASKKSEFVDLLHHGRISADGYNITQQGDVLQLCTMSNVERRKILDGIAGITQYDDDIAKANKQRETAEDTLEQLDLLLKEIEDALQRLAGEREAALKYRELRADLDRCKAMAAHRKLKDLESELTGLQEREKELQDAYNQMNEQRTQMREAFKDLQAQHQDAEAKVREQGGEEIAKLQDKINQLRQDATREEERMNFAKQEALGIQEQMGELEHHLQQAEAEAKRTEEAVAQTQEAHAQSLQDKESSREAFDRLQTAIRESAAGGEQVKIQLAQMKGQFDDASDKEVRLKAAMDTNHAKVQEQEDLRDRLTSDIEEASTNVLEARGAYEELGGDKGGNSSKDLDKALFAATKAFSEAKQDQQDLDGRLRRITRELADLRAAEEAASKHGLGQSRAVAMLLGARDQGQVPGIVGTVAELAAVEERFQTAMQVAAGSNMNALIVEDDAVAQTCIEQLKRSKAGRAKLLPLTKMMAGRPRGQALMKVNKEGCLGFALDLVDFSPRYQNAFWHVLGDTIVVDTLANARRLMGGVRIVTLDGELIEAGGAMVGGSLNKKQQGPAFGSADRLKIDDLLADQEKTKRALDAADEALEAAKMDLDRIERQKAEMGAMGVEHEAKRNAAKELLAKRTMEHRELVDKRTATQELIVKLQDAYKGLERDYETALDSLEKLEAQRKELNDRMLAGTKKGQREQLNQLEDAARQAVEAEAEARSRFELAKGQAEMAAKEFQSLHKRVQKDLDARNDHEAKAKVHEGNMVKLNTEADALAKQESKLTESLGALGRQRDDLYKKLVDQKARMDGLGDKMEARYGLLLQTRAKIAPAEEALAEAQQDILDVDLSEEELLSLPPADELRRKIRSTEEKIDRLGDVNMRALEDYDRQNERAQGIRDNVSRLTQERDSLIATVEEISQRRKDVFLNVYHQINENFGETYKELSYGGKALMELEDPDDPFNGGLILKAQPMGKRVTRLDALSGGEKSLTSMAFIFALQRYDPSCFYYLDEVDQNLDALNSELLAQMVRRNSKFAQFIQVSLRKVALKEASAVYGVTQERPGISKMVLNFDLANYQEPDEQPPEGGMAAITDVEVKP